MQFGLFLFLETKPPWHGTPILGVPGGTLLPLPATTTNTSPNREQCCGSGMQSAENVMLAKGLSCTDP